LFSITLKTLRDDLQKLENSIPNLVELTKDNREALDNMMNGIYDVYLQIVKVLKPFYDIHNESEFNSDFQNHVHQFKTKFTNPDGQINSYRIRSIHIKCLDVIDVLSEISETNVRNSKELKKITTARRLWFLDDNNAKLDIYRLFEEINKGLSTIKTFNELTSFLSDSKIYYTILSDKLEPYNSKRKELDTIVEDIFSKKKSISVDP
jgi:hypothetical protein